MCASILIWSQAAAAEPVDVTGLLTQMAEVVEEIETIREEADEAAVVTCIDDHLVPLRSLLTIAERAQGAVMEADNEGQAALESRKVMVAASRSEALAEMARQCVSPDPVVSLDCPECPPDEEVTDGEEESVVLGPIDLDDGDEPEEPGVGSPFE